MMGRDRQLLGQMGIDIWIPRHSHVYTEHQRMLWRDQSVPESSQIAQPLTSVIATAQISDSKVMIQPLDQQNITPPAPRADLQLEHIQAKSEKTPQIDYTPKPLQNVQHFTWQCVCYRNVAIVVDASGLNPDTHTLWSNIQKFSQVQPHMLTWPMPWDQLQDVRGLASYIEGFIDGLSLHTLRLICLGEGVAFEHLVQQHNAEILPSLNDMMETPSLKKRLWEAMRQI